MTKVHKKRAERESFNCRLLCGTRFALWLILCFWVKTSSEGRVHCLAVAYVEGCLIAVDEEGTDGLSALGGVRVITVSNRAELSSRSLEGFSLSCAKNAKSAVISSKKTTWRIGNHLRIFRASWVVGTIDVACNSKDSSAASSFVVASGIRWSCHGFHSA